MDAVTAAKTRIDKALALLERKVLELKARPATAPAITDDDLFAPRPSNVADPPVTSYPCLPVST